MPKFFPMLWLGLAIFLAGSTGCTMCNTEHMYDYGGVGGKWQRGNPTCGRVGSTLSDAGAMDSGSGAVVQHYGDSWGLIDGEPTPVAGGQPTPVISGELFDGRLIDNSSNNPPLEPGSIMIGP